MYTACNSTDLTAAVFATSKKYVCILGFGRQSSMLKVLSVAYVFDGSDCTHRKWNIKIKASISLSEACIGSIEVGKKLCANQLHKKKMLGEQRLTIDSKRFIFLELSVFTWQQWHIITLDSQIHFFPLLNCWRLRWIYELYICFQAQSQEAFIAVKLFAVRQEVS